MPRFWSFVLLCAATGFGLVAVLLPVAQPPDAATLPIAPAGFAAAIWWLIYPLLIGAALFGVLRRSDDTDWQAMRPALAGSLTLGVLLAIAPDVPQIARFPVLALMLILGIRALFRVGDTDRWLQMAPVAIYCGALTADTAIALGTGLALDYGLQPTLATLTGLGACLWIAIGVQYQLHRAPEFGLAVIWALVAIIVANWQPFNVAVSGLAMLGVLGILSLRGTDTE